MAASSREERPFWEIVTTIRHRGIHEVKMREIFLAGFFIISTDFACNAVGGHRPDRYFLPADVKAL